MTLPQTWMRRMVGSVAALTLLAMAGCCKDKTEEPTVDPTPTVETTAPTETNEAPAPSNDPEWKTKCPQAERPESGTVTVLRSLHIYKEPNTDSNRESTITPGTWVNLLGAKGTWLCIDYPCGVGKLCPGWIEARYSKRKEPVADAGVDASVTKDAEAPKDAAVKDVAPTDAATKSDASRIRIPRFELIDAGKKTVGGTGGAPGGRPPNPSDVKPK